MDFREKGKLVILIIILISAIASFLGLPAWVSTIAVQWGIAAFIGIFTSGISGELIEAAGFDFLKEIAFDREIFGFNFSISAFFIATIIVKFLIFGL